MENKLNPNNSIYQIWKEQSLNTLDISSVEYFSHSETYAEVDKIIDVYARAFRQLRNNPESSITFCVPLIPSTKYAFYALNKMGIRANFVSDTLLKSNGKEYLDKTNTEVLVVLDRFYPQVAEAIAQTNIKSVLMTSLSDDVINIPSYVPYKIKTALITNDFKKNTRRLKTKMNFFDLEYFINAGKKDLSAVESVFIPGSTAVVLYTGGSTGIPKGIEKTNEEFINMANIYLHPDMNFDMRVADRNGLFIPPNHPTSFVQGLIVPSFFGATQVLQPFYNKNTFCEDILNLRLNRATGAPSHYATFPKCNLPDGALSEFRLAFCGGEPVTEELAESVNKAFRRLGVENPLILAYGMSEIGPLAIMSIGDPTLGNKVGKPVPGVKARIVDDFDHELGDNVRGKLEIYAPLTRMKGYFQNPELTAEFWTADGYAKTEDIAVRDENGNYDILGRAADRFIAKDGTEHYLFDIENFVYKDEAVLEAEATKLEINNGTEEIPVIHIVLKPEYDQLAADTIKRIMKRCRDNLDLMEVPYGVRIIDEFGTNPVSAKRDYASLKLIRDGYYFSDEKELLYTVVFPENSDFVMKHIHPSEVRIQRKESKFVKQLKRKGY